MASQPAEQGPSLNPSGAVSRPTRIGVGWLIAGVLSVAVALIAGVAVGPSTLPPGSVALQVPDCLPGVEVVSGLDERQAAIVCELRLPRAVLALMVGALLAAAGACYQGVFRNPLADPYLLGVAAGAGLGATVAVLWRQAIPSQTPVELPLAAFAGGLGAVALTYALGATGNRYRSPATLILAGVAVANFLTAGQTYLMQRNTDTLQQVYSWVLGQLAVSGWHDVRLLLPYAVIALGVVLTQGRQLDVLGVGDEEAASLGLHPQRTRLLLLSAASLGAAAAVAVSGLIGFVGIIVPHLIRLLVGSSYRMILPLCVLFGAAFLAGADLLARMLLAPAELPIGVVTAFFGAPFFVVVLRAARGSPV
ncbi:MAG: FecCD family ABC transporter permease [Micromonosporaceae bacterium]